MDEKKYFSNNEISYELAKELNIKSEDDYNKVIMNDNKNNKHIKKQKTKSKTQIKDELRRKEQILQKKLKIQNRNVIINSLQKHNTDFGNSLELLESCQTLCLKKKRKKSKLDEINNENEMVENPEQEIINSDIENDDDNNEGDLILPKELFETNLKQISNNNPYDLADPEFKNKLLLEIKSFKEKNTLEIKTLPLEETITLPLPSRDFVKFINRTEINQQNRFKLPILKFEQEIMDKINNSLVTIISGETGSGKSTQLPQFLYEYGYTKIGKIGITQPRRIAAIALSKRVSQELCLKFGEDVGYQIRYDSYNVKPTTQIKFMTDGILKKEFESDSLLLDYSVIVIDEAHERSLNTDILIGLLSKLVKYRYYLNKNNIQIKNKQVTALRLVIMSATLSINDFCQERIFQPLPSQIAVESRQFPVINHFIKATPQDYFSETLKYTLKIHRKLPPGGILVFLTGKKEILSFCEILNKKINEDQDNTIEEEDDEIQLELENDKNQHQVEEKGIGEHKGAIILPLFSSLSQQEQDKIFDINNDIKKRVIVVSTNVAETSLTIPNIKYVVDSGKVKSKIQTKGLSFSTFNIVFISQASAAQRSGRAGRTGPGHCYKMYSTGLFGKLQQFNDPEILRIPLDQVILYLKSLGIKNLYSFPFLTFPCLISLGKALRHLMIIGAIKIDETVKADNFIREKLNIKEYFIGNNDSTEITDLGQLMIKFPLSPRYSKIILLGKQFGVIQYTIIIATILTIESIFINSEEQRKQKKKLENKLICPYSDSITLMNIMIELINKKNSINGDYKYNEFINNYSLSKKSINEAFDLINQLIKMCDSIFNGDNKNNIDNLALLFSHDLKLPSQIQQKLIAQIVACGLIENIARKRIIYDSSGNEESNLLINKKKKIYECNDHNEECIISIESFVEPTEFVCYKEIIKDEKAKLVCINNLDTEWIVNIGENLITSKKQTSRDPIYFDDKIFIFYDIKFGYKEWELNSIKGELNITNELYYHWFARFLLEGKIISKFKEFCKFYIVSPSIITNSISLDSKIHGFVHQLRINLITNKKKLIEKWRADKKFLIQYFFQWLPANQLRQTIIKDWPYTD